MTQNPVIAVVIPAYNEAPLIERTLASVPDYVGRIYVVDDASIDTTARLAENWKDDRVRVLRHGRNQGVGAAIVTGYKAAFGDGSHVAAVMAGDAQMDPRDLRALLQPVLDGRADYTKGNRLSHPGVRQRMPRSRWLGNEILSRLTCIATGLALRDSQCGYTALSAKAAEQLPLERLWTRYGYPNDLLAWLALQGAKVQDVTVRPVYADEQSGIGLRHAVLVIPFVLLRVVTRRLAASMMGLQRMGAPAANRLR